MTVKYYYRKHYKRFNGIIIYTGACTVETNKI